MRTTMSMVAVTATLQFFVAGCVSTTGSKTAIYEDDRAAVYLERVTDRKFQASHPISLEQGVIARLFNGLIAVNDRTSVQTLLGSDVKLWRVFSEQDTDFLAPLIAKALSRAAPDQRIGFRIAHAASRLVPPDTAGAGVGSSLPAATGQQTETTLGMLFAHGLSIHIALDEYRHRAAKSDAISGPNRYYPDRTGLGRHHIGFVPEAARRPDSYRQAFFGREESQSIVVDYELLMKLGTGTAVPVTTSSPAAVGIPPAASSHSAAAYQDAAHRAQPGGPEEDSRSLKDLVIRKDMELEALKKEVRALKRQLSERDAQIERLKRKNKTNPPSRDTVP